MLTGIVKATRAHYAALQHKPALDREALDYEVTGDPLHVPGASTPVPPNMLTAGTVWVKTRILIFTSPPTYSTQNARRKREITRLMHRLHAMYPEAKGISCAFRTDSDNAHRLHIGNPQNRYWNCQCAVCVEYFKQKAFVQSLVDVGGMPRC